MIIPIGGGGLASGIALAIRAMKPNARLVGVQTAAFAPLAGGKVGGFTIAEGIAVKHPGELTSSILREVLDDIVVVSDEKISRAIVLLLERTSSWSRARARRCRSSARRPRGRKRTRRRRPLGREHRPDAPDLRHAARALASGRYLVLRTRLPRPPGRAIKLLSLVAEEMGHVLSVEHHREGMDMPVTESEIELTLMMRDQDHCTALVAALEAHGYPVERVQ